MTALQRKARTAFRQGLRPRSWPRRKLLYVATSPLTAPLPATQAAGHPMFATTARYLAAPTTDDECAVRDRATHKCHSVRVCVGGWVRHVQGRLDVLVLVF